MTSRSIGKRFGTYVIGTALMACAMPDSVIANSVIANPALPLFSKSFDPPAIGPGSASKLTFVIDSTSVTAAADSLAFTDTLPTGMVIATPASAATDCTDGVVTATDGGTTISLAGGKLGVGGKCEVTVNVVGTATALNTSGALTSNLGTSTTASATLSINLSLAGISKVFSPTTIQTGGASTLTFTMKNDNEVDINALNFSDTLPAGMVVATPANASTTCAGGSVTANPGASDINFSASASPVLAGAANCTVNVDVTANATGLLVNISQGLFTNVPQVAIALNLRLTAVGDVNGGFATAALTVLGTVGGTVSGLAGTGLVLQNNLGNDLAITTNGSFVFTTPLAKGSAYSVSVKTQPAGPKQTCTVGNGSGTLGSTNVTNVTVTCVNDTFTVGGTVSGLAGTGLVLQNNTGDNKSIATNGSFTFATALPDGTAYAVTVLSQPTSLSQTCTVTNGSGTLATANITNVTVTCVTNTFTVGGTISGLAGTGLVLQNNLGNDLAITTSGGFVFTTALLDGSTYSVSVKTQPTTPSQTCSVSNGNGTTAGANVTNVAVVCATNTFTVGGIASGFPGPGVATGPQNRAENVLETSKVSAMGSGFTLVLQNNGADNLTITTNGTFSFATPLPDGTSYKVTVLSVTQPTPPATRTCLITNGTGVIAGSNVVTVIVVCNVNDPSPIPLLDKTGLLFLIFAILGALVRHRSRFAAGLS